MYDINSLDTTIKHNITDLTIQYDIRGEGKIEKVFVLDVHCFIMRIEDFVG